MRKLSEKIIEIIDLLKDRPSLFLGSGLKDFDHVETFIAGYISGIEIVIDKKIHIEITLWFCKKVNQSSSLYWSHHLRSYYSECSDEELKILLLNTLKEFFVENADFIDR